MIRARIKTRAAQLLSGISNHGIGRWAFPYRNLPVVIGYHRVVEDFDSSAETSIPSQLVSLRMLERHLDWLGRRFRFVTLDEVGSRFETGERSNHPAAAITFDDGYRDFYDLAFPLLKRKGIPAAVFVVTDLVGTAQPHLHDKLYLLLARRRNRASIEGASVPDISRMSPYQATRALLENLPLAGIQRVIASLEAEDPIAHAVLSPFQSLDWETLARFERAGITVGSHTRSHVLLTGERAGLVREEVSGSRQALQDRLQIRVHHFAYPSGRFDPLSVRAVADAGYRYAFTGCLHRDHEYPLLTIPRTLLWENSSVDAEHIFSPSILDCQIHHAFDFVGGCRQSDHAPRECYGQ